MNQNTNSLKTIIIVVLLVIVGYFVYMNYANEKAGQTAGKAIMNSR